MPIGPSLCPQGLHSGLTCYRCCRFHVYAFHCTIASSCDACLYIILGLCIKKGSNTCSQNNLTARNFMFEASCPKMVTSSRVLSDHEPSMHALATCRAEPGKNVGEQKKRKGSRGDCKHLEMKCVKSKPHAYLTPKTADGCGASTRQAGTPHLAQSRSQHACDTSTSA